MIPIAEAAHEILSRARTLPTERLPLDRTLGRFLAESLHAREDVPCFYNGAMDGYAVRAADVAHASEESPVILPVVAESRAGGAWPSPHAPGTAVRIFTGAPLPVGADAIVMQEDTEPRDGAVSIRSASTAGRHVRVTGEVVRASAPLFDRGTPIDPGVIGVLAGQGYAFVPVARRPRVAILSTGDELRELGDAPRRGSLVDSNAHALAAAVREAGGEPELLPLGRDDEAVLTERVRVALRGADVLLSTGGVSVGDYDFVHGAFAAAGVREVFWKVRIKPGKPVRFGVKDDTLVVGLPGNPVSALVTFEALVRPALRAMLGDTRPHRPRLDVVVSRAMKAPTGRTELARARLEEREGALPRALLAPSQGSGDLTSLVGLDVLVVLPEGSGELAAGATASAVDVRPGRASARSPWGG